LTALFGIGIIREPVAGVAYDADVATLPITVRFGSTIEKFVSVPVVMIRQSSPFGPNEPAATVSVVAGVSDGGVVSAPLGRDVETWSVIAAPPFQWKEAARRREKRLGKIREY
jgi:hypothetical protein